MNLRDATKHVRGECVDATKDGPPTNRKFATEDTAFIKACKNASENDKCKAWNGFCPDALLADPPLRKKELLPTKRQASKFRRGVGSAFNFGR